MPVHTEGSVTADDRLIVEAVNDSGTHNLFRNISIGLQDRDTEINERTFANNEHRSLTNDVRHIILQSTTEIAQNLLDIATRTFNSVNNSPPEVTIRKPEVPHESDTIGTAEKVVIGAFVVVGVLTVVAIFLRIFGPLVRSKKKDTNTEEVKIVTPDILISRLSYANLGSDIVSQSSGTGNTSSQDWSQSTGSSPVTDWSELSKSCSTGSRSSSDDPEENMAAKHYTKTKQQDQLHGRYPTHSLHAGHMSEDRLSAKGSPSQHRNYHDEQISIVSTQSLEPLRLEQQYRDRWDDQFDPCGSVPRGNLSHHSHPSESRLSLNSASSGGSNRSTYPTFPIPSKDLVRQIHMDRDRRYPSNGPTVKKEKHVRLSPPN